MFNREMDGWEKEEEEEEQIGQKYYPEEYKRLQRVIEINILNFYYCLKMMTREERNDEERKGNHTQ